MIKKIKKKNSLFNNSYTHDTHGNAFSNNVANKMIVKPTLTLVTYEKL